MDTIVLINGEYYTRCDSAEVQQVIQNIPSVDKIHNKSESSGENWGAAHLVDLEISFTR